MFLARSVSFVRQMSNYAPSVAQEGLKKVIKEKNILEIKDIPRVKGLPFIGTTLDIMRAGSAPKFHEYIHERHKKLGSIFRENIGPLECLFISDPDMIRQTFLLEGKYPQHPLPDAWKLYEKKQQNKRGLLFMDGEEWLYHRKIMNPILMNRDFTPFNDPIRNSVKDLIDKWEAQETGKPLKNLESDLYRWSIEAIINLMLGSSHSQIRPKIEDSIEKLSKVLHRVFKTSAKLFLLPPQICEFFGTKSWRDFEDSVTETLKLGGEIISKCLSHGNLQDGILQEMQSREIPREYIERIIVDLIIAAGDTTSFSTLWCLHILSKHPDIQETLRKDMRDKTFGTADEIPALRATVRETLRLFPVAPFVGRIVGGSDTILGNYRIDRKVMAIVSLFTSSRDPRNFQEPEKFHPQRWMRSETSTEHKPQASLPFAMGARSCIGQKIAMKEICELLRQLLPRFHLKDHSGPVRPILQLITVPDRDIKIVLRKIH